MAIPAPVVGEAAAVVEVVVEVDVVGAEAVADKKIIKKEL